MISKMLQAPLGIWLALIALWRGCSEAACPKEEWISYDNGNTETCFGFFIRGIKSLDWYDASESCSHEEGVLAKIGDEQTLNFLKDYLSQHFEFRRWWVDFETEERFMGYKKTNEECPYIMRSGMEMDHCKDKFGAFICQFDPRVQEVNTQRPDETDEIDNPANVVVSSSIETQTVYRIDIVSFFESESALFGSSDLDSHSPITALPLITAFGTRSNMHSTPVPSTKPIAAIPDTTVFSATISYITPSSTAVSGAASSQAEIFESVYSKRALSNELSSSTTHSEAPLSEAAISQTGFSETVQSKKVSSTKAFSDKPLSDEIQPSSQIFSEAALSNKIPSSSTALTEAAHSKTVFPETAHYNMVSSSTIFFERAVLEAAISETASSETALCETASPETAICETAFFNITPSSSTNLSETVFFTAVASDTQPNSTPSVGTIETNSPLVEQPPILPPLPPSVSLNNSEKEVLKSALSSLRKPSDIFRTLTTNSSTNETVVVPIYNLCPCSCDAPKLDLNPSPEVLADMLSKIQQKLRVNTTLLSSKRNKKVSAKDGRSSSQTIAWLAVLFALIPFLIILSLDLIRLYQHVSLTRTNRVSITKDKV